MSVPTLGLKTMSIPIVPWSCTRKKSTRITTQWMILTENLSKNNSFTTNHSLLNTTCTPSKILAAGRIVLQLWA